MSSFRVHEAVTPLLAKLRLKYVEIMGYFWTANKFCLAHYAYIEKLIFVIRSASNAPLDY